MNEGTTFYVLGFCFYRDEVLLIEKTRPAFMRGLWNGVGGHLHEQETPLKAMIREFKEETGVLIEDWVEIGVLAGPGYTIFLYQTTQESKPLVQQMTDEKLQWFKWAFLPSALVNHVNTLVTLMKNFDLNHFPVYLQERKLGRCCDCGLVLYDKFEEFTCTSCNHIYCEKCMMDKDEMLCYSCGETNES